MNGDVLDEGQVVFGEVGEGLEETLSKINEAFVDKEFRPKVDIRINHTHVLDDPFEDPEGLTVPSRSPSPDPKRLFGHGTRIGADELIIEDDDLNETERKVFLDKNGQFCDTLTNVIIRNGTKFWRQNIEPTYSTLSAICPRPMSNQTKMFSLSAS